MSSQNCLVITTFENRYFVSLLRNLVEFFCSALTFGENTKNYSFEHENLNFVLPHVTL